MRKRTRDGAIILLFGIFVLILGFVFIASYKIYLEESEEITFGECYDKYGNEIVGAVCKVNPLSTYEPLFSIMLILIFLLSGTLILMGLILVSGWGEV